MLEADPALDVEPPPPRTTEPKAHDPYAALRVRDYRLYLISSIIATVGGEMQMVAVGWELYERTRKAIDLGLVGLALGLPFLVLVIPAGQVADRISRRRIVLVAYLLMALASLGLAALSALRGPIGLIYACLMITGSAAAFSMPAKWALVPQLVPKHALTNAITWNSSGWQVASVAGPAAGGLVIAVTRGATWAYVIDVACCLLVFGMFLAIPDRHRARVGVDVERVSRRSLMAGLAFVRGNPLLLATFTLDLFAVLLGGATALLPIYAREILHVGPTGLGWLRAAPPFGAVVMALVLAHRPPMKRAGPALLWAVAGFGGATIVFGLSRNFWLSMAMLATTGAVDNISVVVRATLLQILTPDAMRGRVSAVNGVFIGASNELGGFESGVAAALFGPVVAVVAGGIGSILVVMGVAAAWPEVGRLGHLERAGLDEELP